MVEALLRTAVETSEEELHRTARLLMTTVLASKAATAMLVVEVVALAAVSTVVRKGEFFLIELYGQRLTFA